MDERKIAVALSISGRIVAAATPWARYVWATAGAISMGGGIWSMHFVGMLAFSLPCGRSEEQAIAALLHDAAEDQGGAGTLT
jgi:NO-binding membrane sensor protein with MHYT domain